MKNIEKFQLHINRISIQAVLMILIVVAMAGFISVSVIIFHLLENLNLDIASQAIKLFLSKIVLINFSMVLLFILIVLLVSKVFKKINNYAFYSCTTGLPNKNYMLNHLLEKISKDTEFAAMISLDMDDFKAVNDTLGHLAGDELLKQAGERFQQAISHQDCVCHIGGDEFLFFIKSTKVPAEVEEVAQNILAAFSKPFHIGSSTVDYVTASLGIALMPKDGSDFQTLYNCSDDAMYTAKKMGKGRYRFYGKNMNLHLYEDSVKKKEIKEGIQRKEFTVFYQPKYANDGRMIGAEALARWVRADGRILLPSDFIDFAEKNGLIVPLTDLIMDEVCEDITLWLRRGAEDFSVSVNITSGHIVNKSLSMKLIDMLNACKVPAKHLEFEITESMVIEDFNAAKENMEMMKKQGIKISMDDFGTGYSSLNYLKTLPIDIIKIDKSFIDMLSQDDKDKVLIQNLIRIAHGFALEVIAEGVETEGQLEILKEMQCDMFQGYYLAKPMDKHSFGKLLYSQALPQGEKSHCGSAVT